MDMSLFPYFLVSSILLTMTPGPDNFISFGKNASPTVPEPALF